MKNTLDVQLEVVEATNNPLKQKIRAITRYILPNNEERVEDISMKEI